MKTVLKDAFVDGWFDQGSLCKARQLLLKLLAMRLDVPEDIRERVETCADAALLDKGSRVLLTPRPSMRFSRTSVSGDDDAWRQRQAGIVGGSLLCSWFAPL